MGLKERVQAAKPAVEKVHVPEWDTDVYLKVMSGDDRDAWEMEVFREGKVVSERFRAKLLVRTLCDEDGNRELTDAEIDWLAAQPSTILVSLFERAQRLNKLTPKDVDDLAKN